VVVIERGEYKGVARENQPCGFSLPVLRYNKYPVGTDRELKIGKISENQLKFRSKFSNLLRVLAKIWKT
jgi:hypothetical protein